jgi:methylmalonyl-CoA/ethylmalonyl-CoA epimerase
MPSATPEGARIAHIGIAVRSIAEALPFYTAILGLPEVDLADTDGARISGVDAAGTLVELLEAHDEESPIGKFIARRGPGIHHICFAVDNLEAALDRCRAAGVKLIDETHAWAQRASELRFFIRLPLPEFSSSYRALAL